MDKSDIKWVAGLFCIVLGAGLIHIGFGLIVLGAGVAASGAIDTESSDE